MNLVKNILSFTFATVAVAFVAGSASVAQASEIANGAYAYTATDGNTALNGSTITFQNDVPVSWDLVDTLSIGSQWPPTTIPLTPANSQLDPNDVWAGVYGPDQWAFTIITLTPGVNYYDYFEAQNNLFGPGAGGGLGSLYDGFGDGSSAGTWSQVSHPSVPAAVYGVAAPDASSTFKLFALALFALGACKPFLPRPALARC